MRINMVRRHMEPQYRADILSTIEDIEREDGDLCWGLRVLREQLLNNWDADTGYVMLPVDYRFPYACE